MSAGRAIDGDEPLFDFDAVEDLDGSDNSTIDAYSSAPTSMSPELFDMSFIPQFSHLDLSSFSPASTPAEVVDYITRTQEADTYGYFNGDKVVGTYRNKGKAVSRPMDIQPRDELVSRFDLFSFDNGMISSPRRHRPSSPVASSSVSSPQSPNFFAFSPESDVRQGWPAASYATDITTPGTSYTGYAQHQLAPDSAHTSESVEKGKSRAEPPSLPPLRFSPTTFSRGETNWPAEDPASPRIPGSSASHASPAAIEFPASPSPLESRTPSPTSRQASRHRSLTSLPSESRSPLGTRLLTKSKASLLAGKRRSNLTRNLGSRSNTLDFGSVYNVPANTPVRGLEHALYSSLSAPSTPCISHSFAIGDVCKTPATPEDTSCSPSFFEDMLPREMKLAIFRSLLSLHETDGKSLTCSSGWSALQAGRRENRWIGKEKGFIELIRLSRVSKSWQDLVFDGQLWYDLDLKAFTHIPSSLLHRLAISSGSFIRSVDFTGHTCLNSASLQDLTSSFCISNNIIGTPNSTTQLTGINLTGCTALTTPALHDLISRSPCLVKLNVKGLPMVTNETCKLLAIHCPSLSFLDLSRCEGMNAHGVIMFFAPRGEYRKVESLKRLRLAGLQGAGDRLLSVLGQYAPNLEVLDLSGVRALHNTAIEAFVACPDDGDTPQEVLLTSREAGRDAADTTKYRRRVTKLRHLSLSYCPLLTDHACSHLAHAVPKLEFLELAGIGAELRDDGLVRLLDTTPLIRRLDLDEACEISDATLAALTPRNTNDGQSMGQEIETGSQLEVLNLSYAVQLTNDAILSLIRSCTHLVHIELDSTRVTGTTVKEFVRLARKREAVDAEIVVVDCRHVGDGAVKDLARDGSTRTRMGWRAWEAQHLNYLDSRDEEDLGVGSDECNEKLVALKSFYQWQTVDAVEAAREKRRKAKKSSREAKGGSDDDYFGTKKSSARWWSPGSRRVSGSASPVSWTDRDGDRCIIM